MTPPEQEIHQVLMRRAIALSRHGLISREGGPFGAVVARDGVILGEGWNRVIAGHDPTAHAEIQAIRAAGQALGSHSLRGCDLYTSGEPCPMCLAAAYWARIDRIYYGNSADQAAAIGFDDMAFFDQLARRPEERDLPQIRLLADEAFPVFQEYAADPYRVSY